MGADEVLDDNRFLFIIVVLTSLIQFVIKEGLIKFSRLNEIIFPISFGPSGICKIYFRNFHERLHLIRYYTEDTVLVVRLWVLPMLLVVHSVLGVKMEWVYRNVGDDVDYDANRYDY